jgi:hypothetical protein
MLTTKSWVSFTLWEVVALIVASLVPHTQPGGAFDQGRFWGVFIGMTILWWAIFLMVAGLINYYKEKI